jgi:RNA polymerase nonessential primary-like sigma factor
LCQALFETSQFREDSDVDFDKKEMLLTHQMGRKPSRSELAAHCQMRLHELAFILDCHESSHENDQVIPDTEELHADCTGCELQDGDPMRPLQLKGLQSTALRWLDELSERQRAVLVRRYGLNGHQQMTLEQVGEDIGLSTATITTIGGSKGRWGQGLSAGCGHGSIKT